MLEDPELFLSDKIVTIIISFVTVQSFCIARMVFRLLRNLLKPKLNCEKLTKDMKDTVFVNFEQFKEDYEEFRNCL